MKLSHLQRQLQRDSYQESFLSAAKWSVRQSTIECVMLGWMRSKSKPGCSPQESAASSRLATEGHRGLGQALG